MMNDPGDPIDQTRANRIEFEPVRLAQRGRGHRDRGSGHRTPGCHGIVPLGSALDLDEASLISSIVARPNEQARVKALVSALEELMEAADAEQVRQACQVAEVANRIELDRSLRRLSDVSNLVGIGPRKLQRLFLQYAGVSPTWVLRRYRLLDAAEAVKEGDVVSWATVAADLGFSDQAHLSREFRSAIGKTPSAYAEFQAEIGGSRPRSSNPNAAKED